MSICHDADDLGKYLKTDVDVRCGQVILDELAELRSAPSRHSIQFDASKHAYLFQGGSLMYIEHMCTPNCAVSLERLLIEDQDGDYGRVRIKLTAIADVPSGNRLGFNYNTTDCAMSTPFECVCGLPMCVGTVRGFSFLDRAQRRMLVDSVGEHFLSPAVKSLH